MADYPIRPLTQLADMRAAVDLQRTFWGDQIESVVPAHMLFSIARHGGHVLAAFDGSTMIGLLIGFIGTSARDNRRLAMANLQIVSKRMIVLDSYRGSGIGYRLKVAQRAIAVDQGIRLVEWTFDPLLAANAHLNVRKLGVICPDYLENYYGTDETGGLTTLGSSDRLLAEWWVTNRRVEERLFGKRGDLTLAQYQEAETPLLNPTTVSSDGLVLPPEKDPEVSTAGRSLVLLEIPRHYPELVRTNPALAVRWREHTRAHFKRMFAYGYVVTDFLRDKLDGRDRTFYLFSYNGPQFEAVHSQLN